jgi:hypothetical protein
MPRNPVSLGLEQFGQGQPQRSQSTDPNKVPPTELMETRRHIAFLYSKQGLNDNCLTCFGG